MAVDANVLINERIKQELADGKNAKKAVESAFQKVFWTIVDANVTTLIAALVLLETNSAGPIKGFAVALILGILVSMFTSLYCTKAFFLKVIEGDKGDQDVRNWLGVRKTMDLKFDFLKFGKIFSIGGVVIAAAVFVVGGAKGINWSVDFAGGTELEVAFDKKIEAKAIRDVLKPLKISPTLQEIGGEGHRYLVRYEAPDEGKKADKKAVRSVVLNELKSYGPDHLRHPCSALSLLDPQRFLSLYDRKEFPTRRSMLQDRHTD